MNFTATTYLYAAGYDLLDNTPAAYNVQQFNGSTWSNVGTGMTSFVSSLAVDNYGILYAGSQGGPYSSVAKFTGQNWSAVGNGIGIFVNSLAASFDGSRLYAGTVNAGQPMVQSIAIPSGTSWSLMSGANAPSGGFTVKNISITNSNYIDVAGEYPDTVSRYANNSNSWSAMIGSPTALNNYSVNTLVSANNTLFAGGINVMGTSEVAIANDNGTASPAWMAPAMVVGSALPTGGSQGVLAIEQDQYAPSYIMMVGDFDSNGTHTCYVYYVNDYWDASNLCQGSSGTAYAITQISSGNPAVYAGGTFGIRTASDPIQPWTNLGPNISFDTGGYVKALATGVQLTASS
jgi:hypothetical protein